jgi:hypothetical protein
MISETTLMALNEMFLQDAFDMFMSWDDDDGFHLYPPPMCIITDLLLSDHMCIPLTPSMSIHGLVISFNAIDVLLLFY